MSTGPGQRLRAALEASAAVTTISSYRKARSRHRHDIAAGACLREGITVQLRAVNDG